MTNYLLMPVVTQLVRAFDDDAGLPWEAYDATVTLIHEMLGKSAAVKFSSAVDCTDDRYYLKDGAVDGLVEAVILHAV